jgi:sensor histidine kinase regulating citrate/malate metabolism
LYIPWFLASESRFPQSFLQQFFLQADQASGIATISNIITNTLETIANLSYTQKKEHLVLIFFVVGFEQYTK